jgi:hypothetical protein
MMGREHKECKRDKARCGSMALTFPKHPPLLLIVSAVPLDPLSKDLPIRPSAHSSRPRNVALCTTYTPP